MQTRAAIARDHLHPSEKVRKNTPREGLTMDEARAAARLLQESLEEAFNIQQAMLPTEPLRLPFVEIHCKFRPARVMSGDFLDYFPIGHNNVVGLYLGDIVGKGIAAALYAALALGTLRAIKKEGNRQPR